MSRVRVDIEAPILPAAGLGGLTLRTRIADLEDLVGVVANLEKLEAGMPWYELVSPFEARYRAGSVSIAVDVRTGIVFKLTARAGYRGTMLGIALGTRVAEAMQQEPRLSWDEGDALLRVRGVEGVTLDVPIEDPLSSEVPELDIYAISVFAPELV